MNEQIKLWEYWSRISKDIATRLDITINNDTQSVTRITDKGESYKIAIGNTFKVRYHNESIFRTIRVS